jgi:poly [ADP-ribose] polymerase 10/14/15
MDERYDGLPDSETISIDAGWFPMNCTSCLTKQALTQLSKMMGPTGADCLQPPDTWSELKDPLVAQLFPLPDGPEKNATVAWFMKTLPPAFKVEKVERIQNLTLWQSFAVKRQTVLSRQGLEDDSTPDPSKLERVWLFHGTTVDIVPKIVQQGFNRAFCGRNATLYGKGVYMARDASYSSSKAYAAPDAAGIQRMFLCRVVVGEYCQGVKDALAPSLRDAEKHLLYDTTVDNMRDPSIFVTYHDAQVYPEYLVHFRQ